MLSHLGRKGDSIAIFLNFFFVAMDRKSTISHWERAMNTVETRARPPTQPSNYTMERDGHRPAEICNRWHTRL